MLLLPSSPALDTAEVTATSNLMRQDKEQMKGSRVRCSWMAVVRDRSGISKPRDLCLVHDCDLELPIDAVKLPKRGRFKSRGCGRNVRGRKLPLLEQLNRTAALLGLVWPRRGYSDHRTVWTNVSPLADSPAPAQCRWDDGHVAVRRPFADFSSRVSTSFRSRCDEQRSRPRPRIDYYRSFSKCFLLNLACILDILVALMVENCPNPPRRSKKEEQDGGDEESGQH
jgi:hypothetical protein